MLIFEGPDRTGKTTAALVARQLLRGWGYRHHTKPPVRPYSYFAWFVADARPTVVVDRLHWSEQAYGNTYRGGPTIKQHEWRLLELMLLSHRAQVVLLTDEPEAIRSRWTIDEMWGQEGIEKLVGEYDDLAYETAEPYCSALPSETWGLWDLVDEETGQPTAKLRDLCQVAMSQAEQSLCLPTPSVGYGYPGPHGFLVVGEAQSDLQYQGDFGPRVAWDRGPASEWLWRAIDEAQLPWWLGYYTNASEFTPGSLYRLGQHLRPKVTVALGKVAEELVSQVTADGVLGEVRGLPHPQYWRRFHYHEFDAYADLFRQALGDFEEAQPCEPVPT